MSKQFCVRGHTKTLENSYGSQCIPCIALYQETEAYKTYRKQYVQSQQYKRIQSAARKHYRRSKRGTDYQREYRWRNLGIKLTLIQYKELLKTQNNSCAVCHRDRSCFNKNFSVDHSHSTGIVRGLLCGGCNRAIGYFKDSIESLQNAVDYLKRTDIIPTGELYVTTQSIARV